MRKIQHYFKKIGVLGCIIFLNTSASAATFTAVASGNFSSSTTWGGVAPSASILGDVVIVPSGINVTMDQNVVLNGALSTLTVNGALVANNGNYLVLTAGTLSGNGSITVDSMATALTSGISFTGAIVAKHFTSLGSSFSSSANITVNNTLQLTAGTLTMASGNITLGSNATIVVSGGGLAVTGGVADLTNTYHVRYTGTSATAGLELTGVGLTNIDIAVPASSSVTLASDLNVKGTLTLTSGTLVLNNNDLSFMGNANVAAAGAGTISSTSGSNISVTASNTFAGGLRFTSGANTVNNLTVNFGNSSNSIILGSDLNVAGQLNLQSGMVHAVSYTLALASGATVMGGSASSYVVTGVGGRLTAALNAGGSATYHVGTTTRYAPAIIMSNTGAASANVGVGVNAGIYTQGTTGTWLSNTGSVVDATWHVTSSVTSNINLNMQVMWSANMEVNGFNRTKAYISHYTNGNWDLEAQTAATMSGSMYTISRNNITSLSPFAVMDANTIGVNTVASGNDITIYPNPAVSDIYFNNNGKADNLAIYDISGRTVKTVGLSATTNTISIVDLPEGMYYAHFNGPQFKLVQKFVKK